MQTYGMHTIHGRSLAVATGVKLANPDLQVCVVSGDGDLLSIGGNHTLHAMRRNVDITCVLLNNRIYGLTKGQYSPTSETGKVTKSTPMGSLDEPVNPLAMAVACNASFVARCIDVDMKLFDDIYTRAMNHRGFAFLEVYQDCNIFNHKAFFYASQKETKPDNTVLVEHGKPLLFGKDNDKGIHFNTETGKLEIITIGDGCTERDVLVHDETDRGLAFLLAEMRHPEFPEPIGVLFRDAEMPNYDAMVHEQIAQARAGHAETDLESLIRGDETWEVS